MGIELSTKKKDKSKTIPNDKNINDKTNKTNDLTKVDDQDASDIIDSGNGNGKSVTMGTNNE